LGICAPKSVGPNCIHIYKKSLVSRRIQCNLMRSSEHHLHDLVYSEQIITHFLLKLYFLSFLSLFFITILQGRLQHMFDN
jgi:hypothetical protein